ncbi:MAG: GumC family protein [Candidatus Methylumidiphilus sp.]
MEEKQFGDYLSALRRNKLAFSLIFAAVLVVSLLTAVLLPPVYRSTATILIEEQEIPTDLVRTTITSFATQRLQTISQRVMTRSNLMAIVEKFKLYEDERKKETTDEIVERMRDDISFKTLSADVIDPRSGRPTQATIAFTLTYDSHNAELSQKVANEITSLYLEENLKMRTRQTAEASDFLTNEVAQIGAYATELEQKLSKFKEAHLNELPEQKQLNTQSLDRIESEIKDIDLHIRTLLEHNSLIDGQLAQIPSESPVIASTGQHIMSSSERLKALRTEYISLSAQYSEKHPDVVKLRQEIEALEKDVGQVDSSIDQMRQLEKLRTERASMSEKYADGHPDAAALDRKIAALEKAVRVTKSSGKKKATAKPKDESADNPAYLNLAAQKQSNILEIAGLNKRRGELQEKLQAYEKRLQNSPDVERQYYSLLRDWENTNLRYREMKAKQMDAQVAEQLERKSKGERFSVVEPPSLPEKPLKPNRPAIAVLGLVLALAVAVGYIALRETLDKSVRKLAQITEIVGAPPLAVIPHLYLDEDIKAKSQRGMMLLAALALGLAIALALVHWLWIPLDVLWFRGMRKLDLLLG